MNKRNYKIVLWEAVFSYSGFTFISASSVVPVFIEAYTGNLQLAGLSNSLRMLAVFLPQFFIGAFIAYIRNYPAFIGKWLAVARPSLLFMIPVLFSGMSNITIVWIFILIMTFINFEEGMTMVPWLDMTADIAGRERMGKLLGYQQILGGVLSFGAGFLIKYLLENPALADSMRYSILFGVGGIILSISAFMMFSVKTPDRPKPEKPPDFVGYMKKIPGYLTKSKTMVMVYTLSAITSFSGVIVPFAILFLKRTFELDMTTVSTLVYAQIIGTTAGSLVWAKLSQHIGNKHIITYSQLSILTVYAASFACLIFPAAALPLAYMIAVVSGAYMSSWLGFSAYISDITEKSERSMYYVIFYAIYAPFTVVSYIAGIVADNFGFVPVLATGAIASAVSALLSLRLKKPDITASLE